MVLEIVKIFTSNSGRKFTIRFAEENEVEEVLNFHNSFFVNKEPMQMAYIDEVKPIDDVEMITKFINQKLTLLVFDELQKLVGILLAKALTEDDVKMMKNEAFLAGESSDADILNFLAYDR
jgi:hypothetical protein